MRAFVSLGRAAGRFLRSESGTTAVEYAVLLAFLVIVCMAAVAAFQLPAGLAFDSSSTSIGTYPDP